MYNVNANILMIEVFNYFFMRNDNRIEVINQSY